MSRNYSVGDCGKGTKVYWESSLGPCGESRAGGKFLSTFSAKGGKGLVGLSLYGNSVNLGPVGKFELPETISVIGVRRLRTREYSLPIVANSKVFTTTQTKVFSMGIEGSGEGFQVHKYIIPRRLPIPRQFFFKNLGVSENPGQVKDISKLISKKVKRRTKLPVTVKNLH